MEIASGAPCPGLADLSDETRDDPAPDGLNLPVARTGHLIALKVLSRDDIRRPTDLADLLSLLERASPAELLEAEQLLSLITERGYHRDRDLLASFQELRRSRTSG
jgi:hypothetical protein